MRQLLFALTMGLFSLNLAATNPVKHTSTTVTFSITDEFAADDIVGNWLNDEKTIKVQIEKIGHKFYGKLVWLEKATRQDGSPKVDEFNPDPSLRDVPFIGLRIVKDMQYKGNGVWTGGTIYDPEHGKTYGCKITLDDHNTAFIRGYYGISLIGKSVRFDRVK